MIIYYNKQTGRIIQTVQDRIHNSSLERMKPTISSIEQKEVGILIIKFIPTNPNEAYKPDVEEGQEKFVYELEQTGKIDDFRIVDNKLIKDPRKVPDETIKTILVDLRPTEEEIFNKFSDDIQNEIKQAEQELMFKIGNHLDKDKFLNLFEEMKKLKDIKVTADHYFEDMQRFVSWRIQLYFVENKSKDTLAGAIVLPTKIPEYRSAATNTEGRQKYAGFFLIWNIIKDLKGVGFKLFNLGGVYDETTDKPLEEDKKNINLYKKKWGGVGVTEKQLRKLQSGELKFDSLV